MLHDPDVLILDEPTAGLDVLASRFLRDFVRAERDRGKAVLFSTHYLAEAELLCDRIGLLHRGRLLAEGTPAALRAAAGDAPSLEEAFLRLVVGRPTSGRRPHEARARSCWSRGKELRETLRDRRTLAIMVLFPLVVYPLVSLVTAQVMATRANRDRDRGRRGSPSPARRRSPTACARGSQRRHERWPTSPCRRRRPRADDVTGGPTWTRWSRSTPAPPAPPPPTARVLFDETREQLARGARTGRARRWPAARARVRARVHGQRAGDRAAQGGRRLPAVEDHAAGRSW